MDHAFNIVELVLLVAALVLRRLDARTLRTGLTNVHAKQGALVELVRSSLRPPAPRCGECDHEHRQHHDERGHERTGCAARFCRCPAWVDPPAPIEFADDDRTPITGVE